MDVLLLILGLLCMIVGILGSFLPALPGPVASWLGLLLLFFTVGIPNNYWILGISLAITLLVTLLDYIIPNKGTQYFGGTSYGIWGTNIGLVLGIFIPIPLGFVIGPFLGALIGELVYDSRNKQRAFKAAIGSFLGILASSFIKFILALLFLGLFLWEVWKNKSALFSF